MPNLDTTANNEGKNTMTNPVAAFMKRIDDRFAAQQADIDFLKARVAQWEKAFGAMADETPPRPIAPPPGTNPSTNRSYSEERVIAQIASIPEPVTN